MSLSFRTSAGAVLLAALSFPALAVECASLDDCMMRGGSAASAAEAVAFYDRGIGYWKPANGNELLGRAKLIRAQTRLQLFSQGRDPAVLAAAEQDAREAARLTPEDFMAHASVALILANRGDRAGAEEWMGKAVAAEAGNPLAWLERGNYLLAIGENARALADFDKGISLLSQRLYDPKTQAYSIQAGVNLPPPQRITLHVQRALAHKRLNNQKAFEADMAQACSLGEKRACPSGAAPR